MGGIRRGLLHRLDYAFQVQCPAQRRHMRGPGLVAPEAGHSHVKVTLWTEPDGGHARLGASEVSPSFICAKTPLSPHRFKRMKTVFAEPYFLGASRQRNPLELIKAMPFRTRLPTMRRLLRLLVEWVQTGHLPARYPQSLVLRSAALPSLNQTATARGVLMIGSPVPRIGSTATLQLLCQPPVLDTDVWPFPAEAEYDPLELELDTEVPWPPAEADPPPPVPVLDADVPPVPADADPELPDPALDADVPLLPAEAPAALPEPALDADVPVLPAEADAEPPEPELEAEVPPEPAEADDEPPEPELEADDPPPPELAEDVPPPGGCASPSDTGVWYPRSSAGNGKRALTVAH